MQHAPSMACQCTVLDKPSDALACEVVAQHDAQVWHQHWPRRFIHEQHVVKMVHHKAVVEWLKTGGDSDTQACEGWRLCPVLPCSTTCNYSCNFS